jgi:hypothetical protein
MVPTKTLASKVPLPDKIIPPPEPLPTNPPVIPLFNQTQQVVMEYTQQQLETFETSDDTSNSPPSWGAHMAALKKARDEQMAAVKRAKEQKDAEEAAAAVIQKAQWQQRWWTNYLANYRYTLIALHDALEHDAHQDGDGVSQSEKFFQCLPDSLNPSIGDFKPAEIKFQKNTNMDFIVSITAPNISGLRQLSISCGCGYLETDGEWGDSYRCHLHVEGVDFDDDRTTNISNAHILINNSINDLISSEHYYLETTNK